MKQSVQRLIRHVVRSRGYDLVRAPHLHAFLASREVGLVIDVGANSGTYGHYLRRWGYRGDILSLEPTAAAFAELKAAAVGDGRWNAVQLAAGAVPGRAKINVSRNSEFSSFRQVSELGRAYDPLIEVASVEEVEVVTLDSLIPQLRCTNPFLKIDTQGFEREVLTGANGLLALCVGVQLELPVEHLYEGVWSLTEAIDFMKGAGFAIAQMTPTNPRHPDLASAVEFDCVFRRINSGVEAVTTLHRVA